MTSRKATNGVLTWAQARVILSVVVPVLIVLITYFVMVGGLQARVQAQESINARQDAELIVLRECVTDLKADMAGLVATSVHIVTTLERIERLLDSQPAP